MKELSVEQKARRYDEAKYIMKEYMESGNAGVIAENTIRKAFPELAESEDEEIRKDIVTYLKSILSNKKYGDKFIESWIAWLEKQGNTNKEYWRGYREGKQEILDKYTKLEKQGEQKPADKVESGKKFTPIESALKDLICDVDNSYTIEQVRRFLFEYGYKDKILNAAQEEMQNPAEWSEEDNEHFERILKELENQRQRPSNRPYLDEIESDYKWLKSLKVQSHWKPSEEQMMAIETAINVLGKGTLSGKQLIELQEDLKKLK